MSRAKEKFQAELWERVLRTFAAGVPADAVDTKHLEAIWAFTLDETTKSYRYGKARSAGGLAKRDVPQVRRPALPQSSPGMDDDSGPVVDGATRP